jgi:hypothetical protein
MDDRSDAPGVERLRDRLAIAMLGRANLIAVVGCAAAGRSGDQGSGDQRTPRSWSDVQRLADRIRTWDVSAPVVGIWTDNDGGTAAAMHAPGHTPVERPREGHENRLAVLRWEDDGGWSGRLSHAHQNEHQSPARQ